MEQYFAEFGHGRSKLFYSAHTTEGHGIVVFICGGTHPHLGGVVLASPAIKPEMTKGEGEPTVDIWSLTLPGHKDSRLAEVIAKHLVCNLQESVSVSVGVHVDYASKEEIRSLIDSCIKESDEFIKWYRTNNRDQAVSEGEKR